VENGKKIAECITFIGKKTYGVLRDLCSPVAPSTKTFKELCDLLTTHYKAKRLEMGESYHVKETNQELSESIANYSTLLRDAATCNIGEYLGKALRGQVISVLRHNSIKKKINR